MYRRRTYKPIPGTASARVDVLVTPRPSPSRDELASLKVLDLCEFASRAEAAFVQLVNDMLTPGSPVRVREVIIEAAYALDISTETAKRYLLKHSARRAEYQIVGGVVTLREVSDGS